MVVSQDVVSLLLHIAGAVSLVFVLNPQKFEVLVGKWCLVASMRHIVANHRKKGTRSFKHQHIG